MKTKEFKIEGDSFSSIRSLTILEVISNWFNKEWEEKQRPIRIKSIEFSDDSQSATVNYFEI